MKSVPLLFLTGTFLLGALLQAGIDVKKQQNNNFVILKQQSIEKLGNVNLQQLQKYSIRVQKIQNEVRERMFFDAKRKKNLIKFLNDHQGEIKRKIESHRMRRNSLRSTDKLLILVILYHTKWIQNLRGKVNNFVKDLVARRIFTNQEMANARNKPIKLLGAVPAVSQEQMLRVIKELLLKADKLGYNKEEIREFSSGLHELAQLLPDSNSKIKQKLFNNANTLFRLSLPESVFGTPMHGGLCSSEGFCRQGYVRRNLHNNEYRLQMAKELMTSRGPQVTGISLAQALLPLEQQYPFLTLNL